MCLPQEHKINFQIQCVTFMYSLIFRIFLNRVTVSTRVSIRMEITRVRNAVVFFKKAECVSCKILISFLGQDTFQYMRVGRVEHVCLL